MSWDPNWHPNTDEETVKKANGATDIFVIVMCAIVILYLLLRPFLFC